MRTTSCIVLAFIAITISMADSITAEDWTRFRGENGAGISKSATIPTSWSADKNIEWQIEVPGPGSSSPIVYGDHVYLTCYTGYGTDQENPGNPSDLKRHLLCYDRGTGHEVWRATVNSKFDEDAYKGFIPEHGYASSTPVTDGENIFAFFGKTGMVAFDMKGNQVWQTGLGTASDPFKWGVSGASPILYKDKVIVNAGNVGHALVALNKSDGSVAWKLEDDKFTNCWSTPILVDVGDRTELVFSAPKKIIGIDPDSGKQLWSADTPIEPVTSSVTVSDGVVYTVGGRQGRAIAIRCGGSGDVSETHTIWEQPVASSVGTPVVTGGQMYWLASGSIMMCLSCQDGSEVAKVRLEEGGGEGGGRRGPAGNYASPILVGENIFIVTRNGITHVLTRGSKLEKVASNNFGSDTSLFNATPAVADNQMFVRSNKMLYCIQGDN